MRRRLQVKGQLFYPMILLFAAVVLAAIFTTITANILAYYSPADAEIPLSKMNVLGSSGNITVP